MRIRLTDVIEKQAAAGTRREISDDFKYNKNKIKHIKKILHNTTTALGNLVSALGEFRRFKGPDVSPDGLLGGLGYISSIKDIKEALNNSIRGLSDVADSLADELNNPNWGVKEDKDVKKLIKEKEDVEEKIEDAEMPEGTEPDEDEEQSEEEQPDEEEQAEPEEETEEKPEEQPPVELQKEEQPIAPEEAEKQADITPQDVTTTTGNDLLKSAKYAALSEKIKENLVKFSSIGNKKS